MSFTKFPDIPMRCFVTGATGFIGSHLSRLLVETGEDVAILSRPSSNTWRLSDILSRIRVIPGDLANIRYSESQINDFHPDVVFHLGWHGVASRFRDDPEQITLNLNGSVELLRLAAAAGCKRWIGLGSQAEYGPHEGLLTENLPTRPVTTYGVAKLCVSLLSKRLCAAYDIEFCWLRLLAVYGPMDDPTHFIPHLILKLLARERPALSSGDPRWDYLYVDDAAQALWRTANQPRCTGTFILGSGQAHNVRRIAEKVRDLVDPALPLGFGEIPHRSDQPMHLQADIEAFRAATGWSPQTPIDEGLYAAVNWFRQNSDRYGSRSHLGL